MSRERLGAALSLGYHAVAEEGPQYLSLRPSTFEAQLDVLARLGFRGGTRDDLWRLAEGGTLNGRRAFMTFDDGFADTFTTAMPMMAERGLTGMVFVLPGHLADAGPLAWPEVAGEARRRPELMTSMDWDMAGALAEAGWEIGSHTMSHPRLTILGEEELREELLDSRRLVAERLGRCETLSYPFGAWDDRVAAAAADAGYSFAFTLPLGAQMRARRLALPRLTIDDRDTPTRFRLKLTRAGRLALFSPLRPALRAVRRPAPHSHAD
jgi:peptidoglycan/xylan/chitin deacetylase (PgdA/CDA1 family)